MFCISRNSHAFHIIAVIPWTPQSSFIIKLSWIWRFLRISHHLLRSEHSYGHSYGFGLESGVFWRFLGICHHLLSSEHSHRHSQWLLVMVMVLVQRLVHFDKYCGFPTTCWSLSIFCISRNSHAFDIVATIPWTHHLAASKKVLHHPSILFDIFMDFPPPAELGGREGAK